MRAITFSPKVPREMLNKGWAGKPTEGADLNLDIAYTEESLFLFRPAPDPAGGGQGRHEHVRAAPRGDGADAQARRGDPRGRVRARVGQERRRPLRQARREAEEEVNLATLFIVRQGCHIGGGTGKKRSRKCIFCETKASWSCPTMRGRAERIR